MDSFLFVSGCRRAHDHHRNFFLPSVKRKKNKAVLHLVVSRLKFGRLGKRSKDFNPTEFSDYAVVRLGVSGIVCWIVFEENALFLVECLVQIAGEYQPWIPSVLKVVEKFFNFGFSASMFAKFFCAQCLGSNVLSHDKLLYDGVVDHIPSNLGALDVFSEAARARAYDEYVEEEKNIPVLHLLNLQY
jgi:hypothetical protein